MPLSLALPSDLRQKDSCEFEAGLDYIAQTNLICRVRHKESMRLYNSHWLKGGSALGHGGMSDWRAWGGGNLLGPTRLPWAECESCFSVPAASPGSSRMSSLPFLGRDGDVHLTQEFSNSAPLLPWQQPLP